MKSVLSPDGLTEIMQAVVEGDCDRIAELLKLGHDIDQVGDEGQTALIVAGAWGSTSVVSLLCEAGADIEARDMDGFTPLARATQCGHADVVAVLVDRGADLNSKTALCRTPLMIAAQEGQSEVLTALLGYGAALDYRDDQGSTALMLSVSSRVEASANALISAGASIELLDNDGADLAVFVIEHDQIGLLEVCLAKDELFGTRAGDMAGVVLAAGTGKYEAVELILDRQDATKTPHVWARALLSACQEGDARMVAILLDHGIDPNERDTDGWLPIAGAVHDASVLKAMLSAGADPALHVLDGTTLSEYAREYGFPGASAFIEAWGGAESRVDGGPGQSSLRSVFRNWLGG